jgi:Na+/melibiose symporter-like transporter
MAVLGLPVVLFLQPYFAQAPGLSLASVGLVFLLARVFDVVTDPTLGWVGDVTRTPWGRRKFWIAVNVPVMLLGVWGLFLQPAPSGPWVLLAWLAVLYTGWTFIHMSHLSWASEVAGGYDRRTLFQGLLTGAYVLGILLALLIAGAAGQGGGADPLAVLERQVRAIGWVTLGLLPAACLLAMIAAPEPPVPPPMPLALGASLASVVRSGPLLRIVGVDFLSGLAAGVTGSSLVFIGAQVLRLPPQLVPLLILASFVSGLVCVAFWIWLAGRIGKHQTIIAAAVYQIVTAPVILLIPPENFGAAALAWVVTGANFSAGIFLARAILGDVVDHERERTGAERTGLFFGLMSATNKMGYAAAGLAYVALQAAGYDPAAAVQTPRALAWLMGLFIGAPVVCALLTIALMWRFPVDRRALAAATA